MERELNETNEFFIGFSMRSYFYTLENVVVVLKRCIINCDSVFDGVGQDNATKVKCAQKYSLRIVIPVILTQK